MSINRNLKRLIREYEFLLEDMDDVLEIHKTANQELNRAIRMAKDDEVAESDFEVDEVEDEDVETFEDTPERKVLKKLFRKIVFKCHPDRLPKDIGELERATMQDLYEKAVMAHDRDNWGLMVVVAIKLDIKLPKEAEGMIDRIAEEKDGLKNQIDQMTGSFAWQWYHAEDELQKRMIDDYLNTLKKIKEKNAIEEKKEKKILVVGHPRTGTGYTAKLLQSWGLDVRHEEMGKDGTSNWTYATRGANLENHDLEEKDWHTIVYCVRNPKKSIPSIAYTEDKHESSLTWRIKHGKYKLTGNKATDAIRSIIAWDKLINNMKPDIIFRIEYDAENLFNQLKSRGFDVKWNEDMLDKAYNTRQHKNLEDLLMESGYILTRDKNAIHEYCKKFGYDEFL